MWRRLGITTPLDISGISPILTLGTAQVSLIEMALAYAVFANQGARTGMTIINQIIDPTTGKAVYTASPRSQPVLDPQIAQMIVQALTDDRNRPGWKPLNGGEGRFWAKTGTDSNPSGNPRAFTTFGATNGENPYIVAVWLGTKNPAGFQKPKS